MHSRYSGLFLWPARMFLVMLTTFEVRSNVERYRTAIEVYSNCMVNVLTARSNPIRNTIIAVYRANRNSKLLQIVPECPEFIFNSYYVPTTFELHVFERHSNKPVRFCMLNWNSLSNEARILTILPFGLVRLDSCSFELSVTGVLI